jgi:hypothetical protein
LILSPEQYRARSTDHKTPDCAVFWIHGMCKIRMYSNRLNTAPITATAAKRFCIGSGQYMWYFKYWHAIATSSLNTKYYGRTHLKDHC